MSYVFFTTKVILTLTSEDKAKAIALLVEGDVHVVADVDLLRLLAEEARGVEDAPRADDGLQ